MDIILQSLDIICETKLWPKRTPSHIIKVLAFMQNKGWLHTLAEENKVFAVIGAYRIESATVENMRSLPLEEKGKILYIPFVISTRKEDNIYNIIRRSLRKFLTENQDISEIVYEDKNNKLRCHKIGDSNGEKPGSRVTSTVNVH